MVFVMDALDGCDNEERVYEIIMLLFQEPLGPFYILITNRLEQYIYDLGTISRSQSRCGHLVHKFILFRCRS